MSQGQKKLLEPAIHRVHLDKITIYDITDSELESLERGSPESIFLNLAIAVVSIAVSFSIALATTDIQTTKTFCVFVIVTVIAYLASFTFCLLWWQKRGSMKSVASIVRYRATSEGIQESDDPTDNKPAGPTHAPEIPQ